MNKDQYTPEQVKDIKEREAKALSMLKELQLTPAAMIVKENLGNDVFGDRMIPYLQDIKYSKDNLIVSPLQPNAIK